MQSVAITTQLWVRIPLWRGVLDITLCDKVCEWLATGRGFSLGTPVSSTNKTDRHNITDILLKVALNTIILTRSLSFYLIFCWFFFSLKQHWWIRTSSVNEISQCLVILPVHASICFWATFKIWTFYHFNICPPYKHFSDSTQNIMIFALWIGFLNDFLFFL
jgi:hypothetical protein